MFGLPWTPLSLLIPYDDSKPYKHIKHKSQKKRRLLAKRRCRK